MFSAENFVREESKAIKESIRGKAIIAVSGGVDSTVAAKLVSDAVGMNALAVYVNTGLMREGETANVEETLRKLKINYKITREEDLFLARLRGVVEPEEKRKIIGKTFIEIFEREADSFGADRLVQGTIAPDWIESGGGLRDRIKSHHNVGGLPENLRIKIFEPLKDLYKDEVRKVAEYYGISGSRQPFPGPGFAVRIIGEVTREKTEILRKATKILEDNVANSNVNPWQYFVVLLADRSTGVHGDRRFYGYTAAIRCVDSLDGMTANFSNIPLDTLGNISREITNGVPEIGRVVYDITDKPPATIEWE